MANAQNLIEGAIFGNQPDGELQKLFKTIMDAAAGKPLKTSITEKKEEEELEMQKFIFQLLNQQNESGTESKGTANAK